ncbi:hypothetical protein PR048_031042 [Dryococelus australis]|uniref:Uncharacterized protein n=1 Tax=Dryococelus australis TaxID=614101 RepID=A0ABQ9G4X9_9NEOP|nr:hypothetical protein PR048_031042 [Dryococelus australis]
MVGQGLASSCKWTGALASYRGEETRVSLPPPYLATPTPKELPLAHPSAALSTPDKTHIKTSVVTSPCVYPNNGSHISSFSVSRGGKVVRLIASHLGEQGSIPGGSLPDFRMWELCRTMPLVGGFSRGSPISPVLAFRRCSIPTSLHPLTPLLSFRKVFLQSRLVSYINLRDSVILRNQEPLEASEAGEKRGKLRRQRRRGKALYLYIQFQKNESFHKHDTRIKKTHVASVNLKLVQKGPSYLDSKLFNKLPQHLQEICTSKQKLFLKQLKEFFLN